MKSINRTVSRARVWLTPSLLVFALSAMAAAGCAKGGESGGSKPSGSQAPAAEVQVISAALEKEPLVLSLDGTLAADEDSNVTSVVAGRVVEVLVERGSRVAEGDPLVRLRDVDFRLAAKAARAQLDQARARLGMDGRAEAPKPEELAEVRAAKTDMELAESNLARSEELGRRGVLSAQNLEQIRAQAAAARERYDMALNGARGALAAVEGAQAQLAQSAIAAREATVRAPFAGEIANRMISVGEFVSPQMPLVTLVRTDPLRLEVSVPQQNLLAVRSGQKVSVRVDAVPDRTFEGTIRYVSAAIDRQTRSLAVEAVIPNADGLLRPGLYATARIETGGVRDVAVLPRDAVMTRAGVDRAFVVNEGKIEERVLTISDRRDDGTALVGDGVRPGEQVVVGGLERLADGMSVNVTTTTQRAQLN